MFKKITVSMSVLVLVLCVLTVTTQSLFAHTVYPVTPNANQTTKNILRRIADLPERTNGVNRTLSGQFMGYSKFDWQYSSLLNNVKAVR